MGKITSLALYLKDFVLIYTAVALVLEHKETFGSLQISLLCSLGPLLAVKVIQLPQCKAAIRLCLWGDVEGVVTG